MNRAVLCIALALSACQSAQRPDLPVVPSKPADPADPATTPLPDPNPQDPIDEIEDWEVPHLNRAGCTSTSGSTVGRYDDEGWLIEQERQGDVSTYTIAHRSDGRTTSTENAIGLVEVYDAMRHLVTIEDLTGATLVACATQYEGATPAGTSTCIGEWWPTDRLAYDDCGNEIEAHDTFHVWASAWVYQTDSCIPVSRTLYQDGDPWMTTVFDSHGKLLAKEWSWGDVETTSWSCD